MIQIAFSACCLGAAGLFLLSVPPFSRFQICALSDDGFSINMTEIKKLKLHLRTSYPPFPKFPVYSFGQKTPKRVNRERRTRPKCCDGRKENKKEKEKEASEADRPAQQNRRTGKADGRDRQPEGRGRDEGQRCRRKKERSDQTGSRQTGKRTQTGAPQPGGADGRTADQPEGPPERTGTAPDGPENGTHTKPMEIYETHHKQNRNESGRSPYNHPHSRPEASHICTDNLTQSPAD